MPSNCLKKPVCMLISLSNLSGLFSYGTFTIVHRLYPYEVGGYLRGTMGKAKQ
ncbi:hypothetical protein K445DRAFT_319592 [Daldinia sp. EC12]|nr:hypothetical protein F4774DRAFT_401503 [Daldinia eschscholtzii]OTB14058.1 hypothetical protein K445DRAFT_319592 [Daldinia sp. EC12]